MYRHIKEYEIKYSDVDAYDNLKLSALLGFMQESACLSADELGFGYDDIKGKNIGFILVNWYVDLTRPLKQGETVELKTWPLYPKHSVFLRDYEIYCRGEKVGVASSRWCLTDMISFTLTRIADNFEEGFFDGYSTERSVEFSAWKIPPLEGGESAYDRIVRYCDYDHYFHVNNTRYADYLMDAFKVDELKGKFIKQAQITYVKQCKEGESIAFTKKRDGNCYFVEGRVSGELRVQFKVLTDEI